MDKELHYVTGSVTIRHLLDSGEVTVAGYAAYTYTPETSKVEVIALHEFSPNGGIRTTWALDGDKDYESEVPSCPLDLAQAMQEWQRLVKEGKFDPPG